MNFTNYNATIIDSSNRCLVRNYEGLVISDTSMSYIIKLRKNIPDRLKAVSNNKDVILFITSLSDPDEVHIRKGLMSILYDFLVSIDDIRYINDSDRRSAPRVNTTFSSLFFCKNNIETEGLVCDLSETGMLISSRDKFNIGQITTVQFMPQHGSNFFKENIQIVRDAGPFLRNNRYGCRFVDMSETNRIYAKKIINDVRQNNFNIRRYN